MKKYLIYIIILGTLLPISSYAAGISGYHIDKNINLIPNDPKGNKKVILITIDDGPSKYGRDMVATLERHKAKAIFFINGIHDKNNLGNIAFQANAGFAIGNHTWSHINLKKEKNLEKINKEINDDSKLIKTLTGASPKFFRPPYGMSTQYVRDMVKKEGMISMNWSGAALDPTVVQARIVPQILRQRQRE